MTSRRGNRQDPESSYGSSNTSWRRRWMRLLSEPIAGETTIHRFRLSPALGAMFDVEARRTAEFWLNAADGDLRAALLLASERLNLAAATASRGFLRGRKLNTATGL